MTFLQSSEGLNWHIFQPRGRLVSTWSSGVGMYFANGFSSQQLLAMAAATMVMSFVQKPLRVVMLIPIGVGC